MLPKRILSASIALVLIACDDRPVPDGGPPEDARGLDVGLDAGADVLDFDAGADARAPRDAGIAMGPDAPLDDVGTPPGECDPTRIAGRVRVVSPGHPSASDDNEGSADRPWASLAHAVAHVGPGDTVLVHPGRYVDPGATHYNAFNPVTSGTEDAAITFRSCPARAAVLASASPIQAAFATNRDYITIDGFRVEGTLKVQGGSHCVLENNDVLYGSMEAASPGVPDPSLNWGIALHTATACVVRNNRVHDMGDSGDRGHNTACVMLFASHHNVVEHNWADAGGGTVYSAFGTKGRGTEDNIWRYNVGVRATAAYFGIGSTDGTSPSRRSSYFHNVARDSVSAFELDHGCIGYEIAHNTSLGCETFLYGGYGDDTWVENRETHVWNNLSVGAEVAYLRGSAPASWLVLLSSSDHNFWGTARIWDGEDHRRVITDIDEWRAMTPFGEGSGQGDPMTDDEGRLLADSPAHGVARDGGDPGALRDGVPRVGPDWE